MLSSATRARFWAKINKTDTCWLWLGNLNTDGYGRVSHSGTKTPAHRYSYILHKGEIPDGLVVDHTCHVRHCVNPEHLRAVTDKQNVENRGSLNRNNTSGYRGVTWDKNNKNWVARVKHSRRTYSAGRFDCPELANQAAIALRLKLYTHNDLDKETK